MSETDSTRGRGEAELAGRLDRGTKPYVAMRQRSAFPLVRVRCPATCAGGTRWLPLSSCGPIRA
jgi:hypothetical protein